jgi:hypothetical protein
MQINEIIKMALLQISMGIFELEEKTKLIVIAMIAELRQLSNGL